MICASTRGPLVGAVLALLLAACSPEAPAPKRGGPKPATRSAAKPAAKPAPRAAPKAPAKPTAKAGQPTAPAAAQPAPAAAAAAPAQPAKRAVADLKRPDLSAKAKDSIDRALKWMRSQQESNGSYGNHPGVTAMVVLAFLQSPRKYTESDGPFIRRAVEYVASMAKPNGAIFDKNLPTYNTALGILALHATGNPAYADIVRRGQAFLVGLQAAEHNHYAETDKFYGGIGYGSDERPDLSNLQFALEALVETGYSGDKKVFRRAVKFLERCQNRSESNDQGWASDDGGFIYSPSESKAGGTTSYGSMTYAGLKSLMYAEVEASDPRVTGAMQWVQRNYDLQSHPGMGDTGLYFYYQTFAKALSVYGTREITDSRGRKHDWAAELVDTMLARQRPEGYWINDNPKYWEGNKLMATARALLAIEAALGLTRDAAAQRPAAPKAPAPSGAPVPSAPEAPAAAPAPAPPVAPAAAPAPTGRQ